MAATPAAATPGATATALVDEDHTVPGYPPMPHRYIMAEEGNVESAKRRWAATCDWRRDNNIGASLSRPNPLFFHIRAHYPHFYHLRSPNRNCYVYVEQCGKHRLNKLFESGVTVTDIERHYVFLSEFMWEVIDKRPDGKLITIYDLEGTKFADLSGVVMKVFRTVSALYQEFYPERSEAILIINAPSWFTMGWMALSPFVAANTKKKLSIVGSSESKTVLADVIGASALPVEYGGTEAGTVFGDSPVERSLRRLVMSVCCDNKVEPVGIKAESASIRQEWAQMVKTREQARAAKEEQRARQREMDAAVLAGANGAGGGGGSGAEAAKAGAGTAAAKGVSSAHGESEALARFALVFVEVLAWCVFWSSVWVGGFNIWYFVGRTFGGKGQGEGTAAAAVGVPPAVPHSGAVPGAAAASGVTMPPADPDLPRGGETGEYYASTGAATEDPTGMQYVEVEAGGVGDEAGGGGAPGSGA